jgi:putative MATE family efflux protein
VNDSYISYRNLLRIAVPLSLGAFVQFLVVLTDNFFLSRVSENSINGAGNGGLLYVTAIMAGVGLAGGTQILVARRQGENNPLEAGRIVASSLRMSLLVALVMWILFRITDAFLYQHIIESDAIRSTMSEFLDIRSFGFFFYIPLLVFNSLYMGIGRTRVILVTMSIVALTNIVLDYWFIFGSAHFEPMGHQGAAVASMIAEYTGLIFISTYTFARYGKREFSILAALRTKTKGLAGRIMKLSYPIMLQQIIALGTWSCFYFLVEKVGGTELKVSHIVRNGYMFAFVAVMGIGQTTRTVISTLIARGEQALISTALRRLVVMNMLGAAILSHWMLFYPTPISSLFFSESPEIALLNKTFFVVFPAIVSAGGVLVLLNAIEGSGKTRAGMLIEFGAITIYLAAVYYVTIAHPQPIHIIWMTDYIYFGAMGLMCGLYLRFSNWKYTII